MKIIDNLKSLRNVKLTTALLTALLLSIGVLTGARMALSATFTVTNTNDSGPGSLRQTILDANATPGKDLIDFNIPITDPGFDPNTGAFFIGTVPPTITDPVTIDGATQPGFAGKPIIMLVGGLHISAGNSLVRGLVISRFSDSQGILLDTNGGNVIEGNFIGTDVTGTVDQFTSWYGVLILSSNNTIGGTKEAARNIIITGTTGTLGITAGVKIMGSGATGNLVQGNFIGTDVTGTAALGFATYGVQIVDAPNNTIGGTSQGARNVISGNRFSGIQISGNGATGNSVQGNFIGTDVTGTAALGNIFYSVDILDAPNNTIGGTMEGARNVISGNANGIKISGSGAMGNLVQGNFIGTDVTGTAALGNFFGSGVELRAPNNTVGGTSSKAGNTIAFNGAHGVSVNAFNGAAGGNAILSNRIFSNTGLGIALRVGGNNQQNFPVLISFVGSSGNTIIRGALSSEANTQFRIEFFSSTDCDPSDHGEGENFLGSTMVMTDGSGDARFVVTLPTEVPAGHSVITATATDPDNNTSEFSQCLGAFSVPDGLNIVIPPSAFKPPKAMDNTFVADVAATVCRFRNEGPFVINLPMTRFVGEVDDNNLLIDADRLVADGLLSPTLILEIVAFDVDSDGDSPPFAPEQDVVRFNGEVVGVLTGADNTWTLNTFKIDVRKVKFPKAAPRGSTVTLVTNEIRIDIDDANEGVADVWCTAIDWVALRPKPKKLFGFFGPKRNRELAWRPVLLVHGFLSNNSIWNKIWIDRLSSLKIKNRAINVNASGSLMSNASEIAPNVSQMRAMYGVDKINIVAHSKGGLDSREYIRRNNDIDKLVMLGTPNAGSSLATDLKLFKDILILVGVGLIGEVLLEPGLSNITPSSVKAFNKIAGRNTNTQYTSLAGNYSPGRNFNPFAGPLDFCKGNCLLFGKDDFIVPVNSAHALSYAANLEFTSGSFVPGLTTGFAFHTRLHQSQSIFEMLFPRIRPSAPARILTEGFETSPKIFLASNNNEAEHWIHGSRRTVKAGWASMQSAHQIAGTKPTIFQNSSSLQRIMSQGGIVQNSEINSHVMTIEPADTLFLRVMWEFGNLDLEVIDPNGKRIDPIAAETDPEIEHFGFEDWVGLKFEGYHILNPPAGDWTFKVLGTSVTSPDGEGYGVTAEIIGSSVGYSAGTNFDFYRNSEPVEVTAMITENSNPVTGATVAAKVSLPDRTIRTLELFDDGSHGDLVANDGKYFNTFTNTSQAGFYLFLITAEDINGDKISREESKLVTVSSSRSGFFFFGDAGFDSDNDDLFNELRIQIGVNIDVEGDYAIAGELRDNNGDLIEFSNLDTTLTAGTHTLELSFDGFTIFQNGVDGPYTLEQLTLSETGGSSALLVDLIANAHTTAAYSVNDFQRPKIIATGNSDDFGVDTDDDGLFNQLQAELEVSLVKSDFYEWNAKLVAVDGGIIGLNVQSGSLDVGTSTINFVFSGVSIRNYGVDGPYFIKDLAMFGESGANLVIADVAAETQPYSFEDFDGPFDTPPPVIKVVELIGDKDNFHPGDPEDIPTQSAIVRAIIAARAPEDEDVPLDVGGKNRPVGLTHFFTLSQFQDVKIISAHVEFRFKGEELVGNDRIEYKTPAKPFILIADLLGFPPEVGPTYTVTMNLENVPVRMDEKSDVQPTNLFSELLDGQFDLVFIDDITLDYSELTIEYTEGTIQAPQDTQAMKRFEKESELTSSSNLPTTFALEQNYPNPFNPETEIRFQLPEASHVVVKIFNVLGQEIRTLVNQPYQAGYHSALWDAKDSIGTHVPSGIYIYRIVAGGFIQAKRMVLLK